MTDQNVVYALHAGDFDYKYVGQTMQAMSARMWGHKNDAYRNRWDWPVHRWIKSIDFSNVRYEILGSASSRKELYALEMRWIEQLREEGYSLTNVTPGGGGYCGLVVSEETKRSTGAKISATLRGRNLSVHHKSKISAALKLVALGEGNGQARLSESAAVEIKRQYDNRANGDVAQIAESYGISVNHVYQIGRRRSWAHVEYAGSPYSTKESE